jgi:phosphoglycerate kinase
VGSAAEAAVKALIPGGVLLLENLRFHSEEEANDPEFARALAAYGELFVDDAFAAVHRAHASTVGVTKYLPSVAGLLVEREVDYIQGALDRPDRPLVAIIGGAKVSDKIEVLNNLLDKADVLMIGGAMANTFFLAQGRQVGKSIAEPELAGTARNLLAQAERDGKLLVLPTEVVVSDSLERPEHLATVAVDSIRPEQAIIDEPGSFALQLPDLIGSFLDFTGGATVIWNGPLGIIEIPEFATGSRLLAEQIVALPGATSIIGGGDTASLVDQLGMHDKFTWVSTGGGASLELMAGKDLPGLAALRDK